MKKFWNMLDFITWLFLAIGGLNWGLIAFFSFNAVDFISFGMIWLTQVIYGAVGLSAIYQIIHRAMKLK